MMISKNSLAWPPDWWQSSCLSGLAKAISIKGYRHGGWMRERDRLISEFNTTSAPAVRAAAIDILTLLPVGQNDSWNQAISRAKVVAFDKTADVNYRTDALRLIAIDKKSINPKLLAELIIPEESEKVQRAALFAYNKISGRDACATIIHKWKSLTHDLRDVAMQIFLSSADNMNMLLDALEKRQIQSSSISWPRMVELMNNDDERVRNRSRSVLAINIDDREAVYKKYEKALTTKGDASKGLHIFKTVCSSCHQVAGQYGKAFGPDLASIRNRDARFIMADILNPNRSIADKYETWNIVKKNSEKLNGIIASETPNAITINDLGAREMLLLRSDIKTMEASATSAMPVGLEASISVKDMADIIAFLKDIH
jgi:putative heme-binding domain-containing protein